jgi:hypothetical protein
VLSPALITCKPARRGLSEEECELIAELLWPEVTAAEAAKFFRIIRERRAAECEAGLEKLKLDSIIYTDGWKAYNKLSLNGFYHRRINHDNHDKTLVDGKQRLR